MIPHPLRRKRGAESKRITETRRPIGFLSTQGLCGPRRSLAENVQRRLDVIATYSRLPIVGVSERDTAPFHEMILQVRPRRERGSPRSAQDQDQSFGCQGIVGPPGQDWPFARGTHQKNLPRFCDSSENATGSVRERSNSGHAPILLSRPSTRRLCRTPGRHLQAAVLRNPLRHAGE